MNTFTYLRSVSIFMIMLVLTIPFYSAQTLAAVDITRNSGREGVDGFANARGDLWSLQVRVTGEEVTPEQVKVNNFPFQNCTKRDNGHDCFYNFLFRTSLPENAYPVEVKVNNALGTVVATASSTLRMDGSPPQISNISVVQTGSTIRAGFTAVDRPQNCVGIQKLEFFHQDSLIQTIAGSNGTCQPQQFNVSLPFSASNSTQQIIVIRATDRLGHKSSFQRSFFYDAIAPDIKKETFKVGRFKRFVPSGIVRAPLSIEVHDDSTSIDATLTSTELGIANERGTCSLTRSGTRTHVHACTWAERDINIKSQFSVTITVTDRAYTQQVTIPVSFTSDTTAPIVNSFGVEHPFNGVHTAKVGLNTFAATFTEEQSGMDASLVIADFSGVNDVGRRVAASECGSVGNAWTCTWQDVTVEKSGTVFLTSDTSDAVGNPANVQGIDAAVVLDTQSPVIVKSSVLLVALAGREGTPRDVFQGGDALQLTFDIDQGEDILIIGANVSDVVSDGGFVPAQCVPKSGRFACTLSTPRIISGYDPDAQIVVLARDHAGNEARLVVYFEILGTDSVQNPDFWKKKDIRCSPAGLDVNTLKLASQRMFCTIPFERKASGTTLAATQLVRCIGNEEVLSRVFLMNNFKGSTSPALVFEFVPFEAKNSTLTYSCKLLLTSQRSDAIIQQPEEEQVNVTIRIVETTFDRDLRTIEDKINQAKDRVDSGFYGLIGDLNKILTWVKVICNGLTIIIGIIDVIVAVVGIVDPARITPPGEGAATGACFGGTAGIAGTYEFLNFLQGLCQFATCNPGSGKSESGNLYQGSAYANYQKAVLDWYNTIRGGIIFENVRPMQASSLYDNLVVSSVGLCLGGIIYNLEKLRQIECRYVYCIKNEVKGGIATLEACRELRDYQECKYIWGEVFQSLPIAGAVDELLEYLRGVLKDPVGVISALVVWGCSAWCPESGFGFGACTALTLIVKITGLAESIISAYQTIETSTKNDFCSLVGA